ncbi:ShlB/FhaC/HecB family hemolysin secretion/activation protein [Pseudomonas aeruginosa]
MIMTPLDRSIGSRSLHTKLSISSGMSSTRWVLAWTLLLLPALALLASEVVHAQVPSAGQAIRDIESTWTPPPQQDAPKLDIERSSPGVSAPTDDGPRVFVQAFSVEGNSVVTEEELLSLVADLAGRDLSFADLLEAAGRITNHYREYGYPLARAYLPQQDVSGARIRIVVQEGRYGTLELHNSSLVRDSALHAPLSSLPKSAVVRTDDLERALLLASDLLGANVKGVLRPGTEPGTTDLLVEATPEQRLSGSLEGDNFGSRSTGRYRLGASLNLNSPLRLGDQLSLRGLTSDGHQTYYRVAYQVPVGTYSTRIGASFSDMQYRLGDEFEQLDYSGSASIRSIYLTQPLIRSLSSNLEAQLLYEDKRLRDNYGLFDIRSEKRVSLWTIGLAGSHQDALLGGGFSSYSANIGLGRLHSNDPFEADQFTRARGSFRKLNLSASRYQALGSRFHLVGQVSGQLASGNLDSSEEFSLGGPYGVRAYSFGAGSGDQGWQASLAVNYAVAPGLQVGAFFDTGRVQLNRKPWAEEQNFQRIQSTGITAGWTGKSQRVQLTAAWPVGKTDDFGTQVKSPQAWIQAAQFF